MEIAFHLNYLVSKARSVIEIEDPNQKFEERLVLISFKSAKRDWN